MSTISSPGNQDSKPGDWRSKTIEARLQQIEALLVTHSGYKALWKDLEFCAPYGKTIRTDEPPCLAIVGGTGAGKTTLIRQWMALRSRLETPEGSLIPYLYALMPEKATIKGAISALLKKLGDPNPDRGNETQLGGRLYDLIHAVQVEMIFFDEIQHLIDPNTAKVLHHVSNFLKTLMISTHIPVILIGYQGEAERVLKGNDQLGRRVGVPRILAPFAWDQTKQDTITEFRLILQEIDEALPLDPSGLSEELMACRLYYATRGYLGWMMQLIRKAASLAIERKCPQLNLELLAEAYEARIATVAPFATGGTNPFKDTFIAAQAQDQLEKAKESEQKAQPGVSKRGNKNKEEESTQPRASEVLTTRPRRRRASGTGSPEEAASRWRLSEAIRWHHQLLT